MKSIIFFMAIWLVFGCSSLKVVKPNEDKENNTKILDLSTGKPKLISAVSCKLYSMGNHFSASGKTEEEARKEVLARCHDKTLVSNCDESKITCGKK